MKLLFRVKQIKHKIVNNKNSILRNVVLVSSIIIFFQTEYSPDLYFMTLSTGDNNSCYTSKVGDVLKSADDFVYSDRSIFFVETSCRGDLTVRQLCAVESAAQHHPERQIYVLFTSPVNETTYRTGVISALTNVPNVMYLRVHLPEFANGTPLESIISKGALNRTRWRFSHTSDALRYLLMYKYGGIYLDLDCLVAKPLSTLGENWATAEGETYVASAILSFGTDNLGRLMKNKTIRDFKRHYRGDVWGQNGPIVMTRLLRKLCGVSYTHQMTPDKCKGFKVFSRRKFYPLKRRISETYFKKRENVTDYDVYIYHTYNSFTYQFKIERGSLYEYIAKKHCPITYKSFNIYDSLE